MIMKAINNKKGMSLVEILVVLTVGVMLILIAWLVFGTGFKSYQSTSDRVDVQSQFRLVIDILEEEIGHAKKVTLHYYPEDEVPDVSNPKESYLYVKSVGDNMYSLCRKDNSGQFVYEIPFPLEGFEMIFQMDPTVPEANILTVWLYADGADEFTTGILMENTNFTELSSTGGYNTVYYEDY